MGFKQMFPNENIDFESKDSIHIYTDGSCINNGHPNAACGWAYFIKSDVHEIKGSGGCIGGTNNQMEMTAVIEALKVLSNPITLQPITIYSDSKYVIETLKGNFKIHKNHELWAILKDQVSRFEHIRFIWVKGHSTNKYNNMVDELANANANCQLNKNI